MDVYRGSSTMQSNHNSIGSFVDEKRSHKDIKLEDDIRKVSEQFPNTVSSNRQLIVKMYKSNNESRRI